MITCIVFFVFVVLGVFYIVELLNREKKEKKLFEVKGELDISTIMLFSVEYVARKIIKILSKTNEDLNIVIGNEGIVVIPKDITKEELLGKLDLIQMLMISKRYTSNIKDVMNDSIDSIIFDLWLDYGYKSKYRTIIVRELAQRLESGEISNSTYNEIYRRVFLFDRTGKEGPNYEI